MRVNTDDQRRGQFLAWLSSAEDPLQPEYLAEQTALYQCASSPSALPAFTARGICHQAEIS